ncbi:MAG: lipoyl(octanoyl) transferase LipB [Alistipes sp.]|nr:lipoyl(octanoyl) transferase LipB [Alistipes sp.]MDE7129293.1 lipoyl(octanoyl) transferase LipB [Alistipes sp.]
MNVEFRDLGTMAYGECWALQRSLFEALCAAKLSHTQPDDEAGTLLIVEHPAVYTLGKSGNPANMLLSEEHLHAMGAELYRIDRGGDITFHGPGQLVCYPIIDLDRVGLGIRHYIGALEQTVIDLAAEMGIEAHRSEGASGVWIGQGRTLRKLCALGVKASHSVTMHGLALNVATDLRWFDAINPCGFADRGTTSLSRELGCEVTINAVKEPFINCLSKNLNVKIYKN